ncbi:MAG: hypothetical protein ACRDFW_04665 [bacterium]
MEVKNVVVLGLVLLLVAGVAVNGSRAQPLTATSVAFEQCADVARADRCQSLLRPLLAQTEAELAALDGSAEGVGAAAGAAEIGESRAASPAWAMIFIEVARYLLDRLIFQRGGGSRPGPVVVAETAFDPIK